MKAEKPTNEIYDKWHADPKNWRGFLYYNKQDKRIFPPKYIKAMGWTVNWANPYSILVFVLIVIIAPIIIYLVYYLVSKYFGTIHT